MAEIVLTYGYVAIVDDRDAEWLSQWKWRFQRSRQAADKGYAVRSESGPSVRLRNIFMHREIIGAEVGQQVDHADRDGLNNRRANLRLCTSSQNGCNRVTANPSGFRGVHRWKDLWRAAIKLEGRRKSLGCYDSAHEAARAYDAAAVSLHGEFAVLNFPEDRGQILAIRHRPQRARGSSTYRGVTKIGTRWRAIIYQQSAPLHLGCFATPEAAARAYDEAARETGPSADLNFPTGEVRS